VDSLGRFQRALQLFRQGKSNEGEKELRALLEADPNQPDAWMLLGIHLYGKGRQGQGIEALQRAVKVGPDHPDAHNNLGVALIQSGRYQEADAAFTRAVELKPEDPSFWMNRGFAFLSRDLPAEAMPYLARAIQIDPARGEAHFHLGNARRDVGQSDLAEASFREAIRLLPKHAEAHNNLAALLIATGRAREALTHLSQASRLGLRTAAVLANMGVAYGQIGESRSAIEAFAEAVRREPRFTKGYIDLAIALQTQDRVEEAVQTMRLAQKQAPRDPEVVASLARMLYLAGYQDEAQETLEGADSDAHHFLRAMFFPIIPASAEASAASVARCLALLQEVGADSIHDPVEQVPQSSFHLAYQHAHERPVQEAIGTAMRRACPDLGWVAPQASGRPSGGRIRVGVVSSLLREHTIGKIYGKMIGDIDPEQFELVLFRAGGVRDAVTEALDAKAAKTVSLALRLGTARTQIAAEACDVLFYPEVGMETLVVYLAQARLAPVQAMTWGHPMTSGSPNMDHFLSSEGLDGPEAADLYTETLYRAPRVNTYFVAPTMPEPFATRAELGLPEDRHLYAIPQTLFKLHPDYDAVLADILRQDPKGDLVLIAAKSPRWKELLQARWARTMPDVADRVHWLPTLRFPEFLSLGRRADVVLDPLFFGGGTTSLELFAAGAPIVTCPGRELRSRITAALYDKMGWRDLVCADPETYAQTAVALATDPDRRAQAVAAIAKRREMLYEDRGVVTDFQDFLGSVTGT
jgi:predicted O-linked N-acetylglucosamine transferase (SPINDLY family)